jgi:hypothetical protein
MIDREQFKTLDAEQRNRQAAHKESIADLLARAEAIGIDPGGLRRFVAWQRWDEARRARLDAEIVAEDDEPFTYLIAAGDSGAVKIGRARNVSQRLSDLQTGNHEELWIIRICYGDDETAFHRRFGARCIHGEWFRFCNEMLTFATPTEQKFLEYKKLMEGADAA